MGPRWAPQGVAVCKNPRRRAQRWCRDGPGAREYASGQPPSRQPRGVGLAGARKTRPKRVKTLDHFFPGCSRLRQSARSTEFFMVASFWRAISGRICHQKCSFFESWGGGGDRKKADRELCTGWCARGGPVTSRGRGVGFGPPPRQVQKHGKKILRALGQHFCSSSRNYFKKRLQSQEKRSPRENLGF